MIDSMVPACATTRWAANEHNVAAVEIGPYRSSDRRPEPVLSFTERTREWKRSFQPCCRVLSSGWTLDCCRSRRCYSCWGLVCRNPGLPRRSPQPMASRRCANSRFSLEQPGLNPSHLWHFAIQSIRSFAHSRRTRSQSRLPKMTEWAIERDRVREGGHCVLAIANAQKPNPAASSNAVFASLVPAPRITPT